MLQTAIMNHFDMNNTKFSFMYSVYSLPNMICPLFGGLFIDRFGNSKSLIAVTFMAALGQIIITIGAHTS